MFCFAENVAGDAAEVTMLMPPATSVREIQPTASDWSKISAADVVVENGFGLEAWLDRAVATALKPGALRVVAARGLDPIMTEAMPNPDVWLDPVSAIREVENIRDSLMKADPAHADTYLANANRFSTRLRDLDDEIGRTTETWRSRRVLIWRDAFAYFAARYGFEMTPFFAADPALPSIDAQRLRAVAQNFTALFVDSSATAKRCATAFPQNFPIIVLDPMESGAASSEFYETTTRKNLRALAQTLH